MTNETRTFRFGRTFGGSTWVHQTDLAEEVIYSSLAATGLLAKLTGRVISNQVDLVRGYRDYKMGQAAQALAAAAEAGAFDQLQDLATRFTHKYGRNPTGPLYLSLALLEKGEYGAALAAGDHAVQRGLDALTAADLRISIYMQQGNMANLLKECTALMQHPDRQRDALHGRAQVLMTLGDLDQALADAQQVLALLPDALGYCLRGDVMQARGEHAKAVEDYTRAIRLAPDEPDLLVRRAELQALLGKEQAAQADREAAARLEASNVALAPQRQAQALLDFLRAHGIVIRIARNGRDVDVDLARLQPERRADLQRLAREIFQLLAASNPVDAPASENVLTGGTAIAATNAADDDVRAARDLLANLRSHGVWVALSRDGHDLVLRGTPLKPETQARVDRLRSILVQILVTEGL